MADSRFVLDCSVALAWCFVDEQDPYALEVLTSFGEATAVVPPIWASEVCNGLLMGERRGRSTEANTIKWLSSLGSLPIEVDATDSSDFFAAVAPLARAHGLTSYDASYLEVAARRSLPFATLELRLRKVAAALGVGIYQPKTAKRRK
ncbi:MAG: VapC toxin family PIN domain ribonuclease [Planctomycetota bacterium]|nr:MAG: VapC toxin family PIN domain ribonuclease [Planctomycetota bacterium]